MALHCKIKGLQNRTHLKNKRTHYSEVTGNKEVSVKIVRVCPLLLSFSMLSLTTVMKLY